MHKKDLAQEMFALGAAMMLDYMMNHYKEFKEDKDKFNKEKISFSG